MHHVLNRGINVLADADLTPHNRADETLRTARGTSAGGTVRIPRRAGARSFRPSRDVRARDAAAARRRAHASRLFAGGDRHASGTDHGVLRIPLPARHHLRRPAGQHRHPARPRWSRGRGAARRSGRAGMAPAQRGPRATPGVGLHRRIPPGRGGTPRRPGRHHALVARRRPCAALPPPARRARPDLGARRKRLHLGGSERGNGSRARADRGGSGRGGCPRRRASDGRVPAPAGRSEPVQRSAAAAGRADPVGARAGRLGRRAPRGRLVRASAGAPGRQERPSSDPRIPQGAGSRSGGGDRATAAGGGAPRPAAVRRGPRGGGVALRLRQRRGPAPRLPPLPARDAVRLPRALLGAAGARLVSFANRRIHPAFVIAGAIFVVLLCAAAVRATPSILIVPLEREFGWSRAVLSSAVSVNLVLYGLVGPFAAALMERFGIRRTILVSLAVICAIVLPIWECFPTERFRGRRRRRNRARIRSPTPFAYCGRARARPTSGSSPAASSSAARAPTAWSVRTSFRPAWITASPKCAPPACWR